MTHKRFSAVAIALHWAIASLLIYNLWLGWRYNGPDSDLALLGPLKAWMESIGARGLERFNILQLHKSVGFAVLALSLARFAWRLVNPPPHYPPEMKAWEKAVASLTHWSFYIIMVGLPLTGWIMVSASPTNLPTVLFKTLPMPHLGFIHDMAMPARRGIEEAGTNVHHLMAIASYVLIVLHVGAALQHQFIKKDGVLWRMLPLPFLRPKAAPAVDAAAVKEES